MATCTTPPATPRRGSNPTAASQCGFNPTAASQAPVQCMCNCSAAEQCACPATWALPCFACPVGPALPTHNVPSCMARRLVPCSMPVPSVYTCHFHPRSRHHPGTLGPQPRPCMQGTVWVAFVFARPKHADRMDLLFQECNRNHVRLSMLLACPCMCSTPLAHSTGGTHAAMRPPALPHTITPFYMCTPPSPPRQNAPPPVPIICNTPAGLCEFGH